MKTSKNTKSFIATVLCTGLLSLLFVSCNWNVKPDDKPDSGTPETPVTPDTPEKPGESDAPETPTGPETPEIPETPAVQVNYVFTETPVKIEVPENASYKGSGAVYYKFGDYAQTKVTDADLIAKLSAEGGTEVDPESGWLVGTEDRLLYGKVGDDFYVVEPIVWRLLTTDYEGTGNALLMAEKVLENGPYNDTVEKKSETVYASNYESSRLRAYLNGYGAYKDDNIINKAFIKSAREKILTTEVRNDAYSTGDNNDLYAIGAQSSAWAPRYADGTSGDGVDYTCANTNDKLFIISQDESTTNKYKFPYAADVKQPVSQNEEGEDLVRSSLIRTATEFAAAKGSENKYFTRTPYYKKGDKMRYIDNTGYQYPSDVVTEETIGIVPLLTIENTSLAD